MKTKPVKLAWGRRSHFWVIIDRGDQQCNISIGGEGDRWIAVALTTPSKTKTAPAFFDNHSHKIIGEYVTLGEAMLSAESWAAHWLKGHKVTNAKKCLCQEMKIA